MSPIEEAERWSVSYKTAKVMLIAAFVAVLLGLMVEIDRRQERAVSFEAAGTWQCVVGALRVPTGITVDHAERMLSIHEDAASWRFYIDGSLVCEARK